MLHLGEGMRCLVVISQRNLQSTSCFESSFSPPHAWRSSLHLRHFIAFCQKCTLMERSSTQYTLLSCVATRAYTRLHHFRPLKVVAMHIHFSSCPTTSNILICLEKLMFKSWNENTSHNGLWSMTIIFELSDARKHVRTHVDL